MAISGLKKHTPVTRPNAKGASAASASVARSKKPPMHLAFDVYLDLVNTPAKRDALLKSLKGQLKKGDTVWLAVEGFTVAKNPGVLDQLAAEKTKWVQALGADGINVKTRIRFERIHTNLKSSVRPGLENIYDTLLKPRAAAHQPIADAISYDYEAFRGFTGGEYTPHDTANAARLFAQGQKIAKALGTSYFVEPSVSGAGKHVDSLHHVTLDWQKLARYTDGFNFQTQRIVAGTSKDPSIGAAKRNVDRNAFGDSVGKLVEGITHNRRGKSDWVMAQVSTEWSKPETVVAAAAAAREKAPDIKSYYVWWYDTGRSNAENTQHLLAMIKLWNKTFHRG